MLRFLSEDLAAVSDGDTVKSSHYYLYNAFNNANCVEAALHQLDIKLGGLTSALQYLAGEILCDSPLDTRLKLGCSRVRLCRGLIWILWSVLECILNHTPNTYTMVHLGTFLLVKTRGVREYFGFLTSLTRCQVKPWLVENSSRTWVSMWGEGSRPQPMTSENWIM